MATSSLALECLVSPTLPVSRRPVTMPSASRSFSSGLLCPGTRLAASRSFTTRSHDPFYDVYGATKSSHTELQGSRSRQPADIAEMTCYVKHKNTDDALHLRLLMPGLAKEDAKVYVVKDELIVGGLKEKDFEDDDEDGLMLIFRIQMPMDLVKADAITTEMKDGLLKVFIPKTECTKDATML